MVAHRFEWNGWTPGRVRLIIRVAKWPRDNRPSRDMYFPTYEKIITAIKKMKTDNGEESKRD